MSRSGYDYDYKHMNIYRGTVERAISGKRGQTFLRELATQMDAMPDKKLISDELVAANGECCALGVFCKAKGICTDGVDVDNPDEVGRLVGISTSMTAEIAFENDERCETETPEERWARMRKWVENSLLQEKRK